MCAYMVDNLGSEGIHSFLAADDEGAVGSVARLFFCLAESPSVPASSWCELPAREQLVCDERATTRTRETIVWLRVNLGGHP